MRYLNRKTAPLAMLLLTVSGCGEGAGEGGVVPAAGGDLVAPTVNITAPAPQALVTGTTTIRAGAADNVGVNKVEFYLDGVLKGTATSAPYACVLEPSLLSQGNYTLTAKAYDAANNGGQSVGVAITVPPVTASMNTVISGNAAVATVSLAGPTSPAVYGLNLSVTMPAGASIASATQVGVASHALAPQVNGGAVILAAGTAFEPGQVMRLDFVNVPAGAVSSDFGVALSAIFGGGGIQIQ